MAVLFVCAIGGRAQRSSVGDVPMLFRGPMPAVELMINGKGPFVFAIDTGAQGLARVDTSVAESLNLQSTGKVRASDGSRSNTIVLDVVHIDSGNTIGGFVLPAVLVEKLKLASPAITVGRARTVTSEVEIKEARLNESIKLGRFEFTQPTITFPALSDEANIG